MLPWYFCFYAGWLHYIQSGRGSDRIRVCTYEEMLRDPVSEILGVVRWIGQGGVTGEDVEAALAGVEGMNTRKNKAVTGRGQQLPAHLIAEVRRMASYYPEIDFSDIGIGGEGDGSLCGP